MWLLKETEILITLLRTKRLSLKLSLIFRIQTKYSTHLATKRKQPLTGIPPVKLNWRAKAASNKKNTVNKSSPNIYIFDFKPVKHPQLNNLSVQIILISVLIALPKSFISIDFKHSFS